MSNDLIVDLPFASHQPRRAVPKSIRALRAAPGASKLLSAPLFSNSHRAGRSASPKLCSLDETRELLHRENRAVFGRIGMFSARRDRVSLPHRQRILPGRDVSAVLSTVPCAARTGDTIGVKWSEIDQKE